MIILFNFWKFLIILIFMFYLKLYEFFFTLLVLQSVYSIINHLLIFLNNIFKRVCD